MSFLAQDIPTMVFQLLPGFVTAGIFYSLTAHPKTTEFERVVQALIFTALLKVLVIPIRGVLLVIGGCIGDIGSWNTEAELAWMFFLAFLLGLFFAWLVNHDIFHRFARWIKLTSRTSYPSEWCAAFTREGREKRWIILTLGGGERLYGWPEEYPDRADGHFIVGQPEWVMDDDSQVRIPRTSKIMISASEVKRVQFLEKIDAGLLSGEERRGI